MSAKHKKSCRKWIFADLPGGLGNQLFTYYFSASLIQSGNYKLFLNTRYVDLNHSNGKSNLNGYLFGPDVHFYNFGFFLNRLVEPIKRHLGIINKLAFLRILVLDDTNKNYLQGDIQEIISLRNPKIIFVFGFWQDLSYFKQPNRLLLKKSSKYFTEISQRMETESPIIFHYRLGRKDGDWENPWGALDSQYLERARAQISQSNLEISRQKIWVFSNEINEARKILKKVSGLEFIDDSNLAPCELFELFAKSKALICSNSTFGILAANVGSLKFVFVPKSLSRDGKAIIGGLPENWITIESSWLK